MTVNSHSDQCAAMTSEGIPSDTRPVYFKVLAEALDQLTAAGTRAAILAVLRDFARSLVGADGVAIVLREGGECFYAQVDSPEGELWEGQRFPLLSCVSGWAMLERETAVVADVFQDPRVPHEVYRPTFVNSMVMVPVGRGEPEAAIGAYWAAARKPGDDAVALLETLARAAGGALARCAADERILASERQLRSIFRNTPVGLGVACTDGKLAETNERYASMFGYAPHELEGRSLLALSHPDDAAELERRIKRLAAGKLGHFDLEQRYRHKTGRDVWVSSAYWIMDPEQGETRRIASALLDVTHQKEAEVQLAWAQRMDALSQLTGGIAHDFNNLLTVINGSAEMLVEAVRGQPGASALADIIQAAGEKGAVLTARLLSFTRRESNEPQVLHPDEVLADMCGMLETTLRQDIILELALACPDCVVLADLTGFETAILNLVLNARDAMPGGGTLTISTTRVAGIAGACDHVLISVRDTGTGMAPEVRARAFEPFFTTKAHGAGTGLGLSMVYGFAGQSHGTASIDSRPGAGTEVRLCLPLALGAAPQEQQPQAPCPMGAGERVLLVEDNDAVRGYLLRALDALGYRADAVEDIGAALQLLAAEDDYDILLGDWNVLGGQDAAAPAGAAVRLRPALKIVLSANPGDPRDRHDTGAAVPLLYKPFGRYELAMALARVLGKVS